MITSVSALLIIVLVTILVTRHFVTKRISKAMVSREKFRAVESENEFLKNQLNNAVAEIKRLKN